MIAVNEDNVIFKLNRRTAAENQSSFSYLLDDMEVQDKCCPRAYRNVLHTGSLQEVRIVKRAIYATDYKPVLFLVSKEKDQFTKQF